MRHPEARIVNRVIAVLVLPLAASLLAACGSPSAPATDPASMIPASKSAATAAAGSAAAAPTTFTASGTATDGQGNKATASVTIGKPVAQYTLTQTDLNACGVETQLNNDPDSTAAIPVQVTVDVTGSAGTSGGASGGTSGANVSLALDGTNVVAPGGSVVISSNSPTWATDNGGAECGSSNGGDLTLTWNDLDPHHPVVWSGWLLDPDVISSGAASSSAAKQVVFLEPVVSFGNGNASFAASATSGQDLLNCAAGVQSGPVIAVNPGVARGDGCTAYSGS